MSESFLEEIKNEVTPYLTEMLNRSKSLQTFLARNVYRKYQNAQRDRWKTENVSQGPQWKRLSSEYQTRKLKEFKEYPGGGRKTMIATNRLQKATIGGSGEHRVLVRPDFIEISVDVPYAFYADAARPFMTFSDQWIEDIENDISEFIRNGKIFG